MMKLIRAMQLRSGRTRIPALSACPTDPTALAASRRGAQSDGEQGKGAERPERKGRHSEMPLQGVGTMEERTKEEMDLRPSC